MTLWKCEGVNTENWDDVRFRIYTRSAKKALAFGKIPKIQFSDSGHGIIFTAFEVSWKDEPVHDGYNSCRDHVLRHWKK